MRRHLQAFPNLRLPFLFGTFALTPLSAAAAPMAPFNACTPYAYPFLAQSFAGGAPYAGCAEWSAMKGRNACIKKKGVPPAVVTYQGDHLQMWLPEFYIEVTTVPGESAFTLRGCIVTGWPEAASLLVISRVMTM